LHPVRTQPLLRHGRVTTLVDPTKFWQGAEISSRCFCHVSRHVGHCTPLNVNQICFPGRTVDSPCTYNVPRAYEHHPSKFHHDRINCLDTVHSRDQQTDRPTELWGTSIAIWLQTAHCRYNRIGKFAQVKN